MAPSSCLECTPANPCSGCMLEPFKRRPGAALLCRVLGRMKNRRRRRRHAGSFSSVRAIFWPLMSMRSETETTDRNDDDDVYRSRPPLNPTTDSAAAAAGGLAPSLSLNAAPAAAPPPPTAARVLALRSRLGEAAALSAAAAKPSIAAGGGRGDHGGCDGELDVEEACGSFEKHLVEMLVEEKEVRDLMDVEELLCCWEKLRCPVFIELVGRFYGELCVDLFSGRDSEVSSESSQDLTVLALA